MLARAASPRCYLDVTQVLNTAARRNNSTAKLSNGVTLAYEVHKPRSEGTKADSTHASDGSKPIVFIHGLFGSRRNNRSIILARDLKRPVFTIDCRNHGDSSHHPEHNYDVLAEDLELFMRHFQMQDTTLIGHSMGAKIAMAVALRQRHPIANVIPVDNAPVDAALKSDFTKYTQAMRRIEDTGVHKQSEADSILAEYEPDLGIRQFLLTNLVSRPDGTRGFRVPLRVIANALSNLGDFPFRDPDSVRFEGPALFVRGTKSHYVADEMLPTIGRFFPKFRLADIDAGHWVISEKPEDFRKAVVEFLRESHED